MGDKNPNMRKMGEGHEKVRGKINWEKNDKKQPKYA